MTGIQQLKASFRLSLATVVLFCDKVIRVLGVLNLIQRGASFWPSLATLQHAGCGFGMGFGSRVCGFPSQHATNWICLYTKGICLTFACHATWGSYWFVSLVCGVWRPFPIYYSLKLKPPKSTNSGVRGWTRPFNYFPNSNMVMSL